MESLYLYLLEWLFGGVMKSGGAQNMEWSNKEQPQFRNFKITNVKITNDKLFDFFIQEFIFSNEIVKF